MLVGNVKFLDIIKDNNENLLSSSSVNSNFIDNEIFESALEDCESIKKKIYRNEERTPFFNQLSKDIFNSLYKIRPEIYDKSNVHKSLEIENNLLREIVNNENFQKLRENTSGDMFSSTLALSTLQDMAGVIIEEWERNLENKKTMEKVNEAISKQYELDGAMEELSYDEDNEKLQKEVKELKEEVTSANKDINNNEISVGTFNYMCDKLSNVVKRIEGKVSKTANALSSLGLSGEAGEGTCNGMFNSTTFEDKMKIAEALKNSSVFRKMADELGRIKETIGKVGKKPSKYGQVICDIGNGNDIRKVLSTEKVKLFDEKLELDFYKRYSEKTLLEYKTMGVEDFRGPIVVCLDSSGSMNKESKDPWAKAVTIATLQLAIQQKRNFRCILFCTSITAIFDFEKGNLDVDKMIKLVTTIPDGGTSFKEPLEKALESINESKFKKADVLFITDGCPFNLLPNEFKTNFNLVKERKGFKVQSILIGETNERFLKEFSDDIVLLDKLNKNEKLSGIFDNMKDE